MLFEGQKLGQSSGTPKLQSTGSSLFGGQSLSKVPSSSGGMLLSDYEDMAKKDFKKIYQSKLEQSIKKANKETSLIAKLTYDKDYLKRAEVEARNKALSAYQDKYGYDQQPEVLKAINKNIKASQALSSHSKEAIKNTEEFRNVLTVLPGGGLGSSLADLARTGVASIRDLGSQISTGKSAGEVKATQAEIRRERLGLNQSEWNKLSQGDKNKLAGLQAADTGLGVLDLLPAASLTKSVATAPIKLGSKALLKGAAIRGVVGTGAGGVIGAGGTALMGGNQEQVTTGALKGMKYGLIGGITSSPFDIASDTISAAAKATSKQAIENSKNQIADNLIAAAKNTKDKYKQNVLQKIGNTLLDVYNPARKLRGIDKKMGWKEGNSLEASFDESINYKNKVEQTLQNKQDTGLSVYDVIQTHAKDSDQFNVYRNAVRDLSERKLGKSALQPDITKAQLKQIVKDYETVNPNAKAEIATINKAVNEALAYATKKGLISEELETSLANNIDYTPVRRATPEMETTPVATGRNLGSVSQQKVVQKLSGGEGPLDTTFDPILTYISKAYQQGAQSQLANRLLQAHKAGAVTGSNLLVTAGNKAVRKTIKTDIASQNKEIKNLSKKMSLTKREASKLETAIRNLNKKGRGELSKEMKKFIKDYDTKLAGDTGAVINPEELKNQILSLDSAEIRKIKKMIGNRDSKLVAKLDEIANLKQSIAENKNIKQGLQETKFEFTDDPTTGLSTISGLDNGQKFTLEVPPEIGKTIKGLDIKEQGRVVKLAQGVVKILKTFWTGPLNPLFTIKNILYDASANVNALIDNPRAFAQTFRPDSIKEMLKSVSSKVDYQKSLHYGGASTPGGSQLPTDVARGVESIMSKRSKVARTGYLIKHPGELLEVADIMSGKFSAMTRTRISRGYYNEALRKGMSKEDAMKEAIYAYNNISPNFQRAAALAKSANLISPYFSASVSGTRSMLQPIMKHPKRALAVYAAISSSFAAATVHNMSTEAGQAFYQDMEDADNQSVLDNNYIIVLPTASKDPKTGKWSGIVKIPLAPEYRSLNHIVRKESRNFVSGEGGENPAEFAGQVFDFTTGGVRHVNNPLVDTIKILYNVKPQSTIAKPEPLVQGRMADLPKKEQVYKFTSEMAKMLSDITGNTISPVQADAMIRQLGMVGATTNKPLEEQFSSAFEGAYAKTSQARYYDIYDPFSAKKSSISSSIKSGTSDAKAKEKIRTYNSELEKAVSKYSNSYERDSKLLEALDKLRIKSPEDFIYNAKD